MDSVISFVGSFYDILVELFNDNWFGKILAVLMVAILLMLLAFVLYGIYYALDSWFLPREVQPGHITGHHHSAASTQYVSVYNGTTTTMIPQHIPESWSVSVMVDDGRRGSMGVDQRYYLSSQHGQEVNVHYVSGRISGSIYVRQLSAR